VTESFEGIARANSVRRLLRSYDEIDAGCALLRAPRLPRARRILCPDHAQPQTAPIADAYRLSCFGGGCGLWFFAVASADPQKRDLQTATTLPIKTEAARRAAARRRQMRRRVLVIAAAIGATAIGTVASPTGARAEDDIAVFNACREVAGRVAREGLPLIAPARNERFLGKVPEAEARCRGGDKAVARQGVPWVDWANYWASGDVASKSARTIGRHILDRNQRGLDGALLDLEYQRMELIKFNLFDNKTFPQYLTGTAQVDGAALKVWNEMRLPPDHPSFAQLQVAADGTQLCKGELIRHRTLTGICNDIRNPAMGSSGQLFGRNVEFESTFPDLQRYLLAKNRHGDRLALLRPDPQVISRKLFTRDQTTGRNCNQGHGAPDGGDADCAYKKASFFNVLATFWIQFMTHDWFSHLQEARNDQSRIMTDLGCASARVNNAEQPLSVEAAARLGCRKDDKMEAALVADDSAPGTFQHKGAERLQRAHKTTRNTVTAWWDASQIYGFDEISQRRVRRDAADPAKLEMMQVPRSGRSEGDRFGYLPVFRPACAAGAPAAQCDPIQPEWVGQESAAFPDSWSIGLSFYHNLFVREHNTIVDAFRELARETPDADSGLRNPDRPTQVITYAQVSANELFEVARLIVSAEIAKIHTIEWTTQLLYNEPLYTGMNGNWSGVFADHPLLAGITSSIVRRLGDSGRAKEANQLYSAFAAGPGIVGLGSSRRFPPLAPASLSEDRWDLSKPDDVNGGVNHFGSPFNFPEEFPSVYRLHPLVPDLLEFRQLDNDPNVIRKKVAVIDTFRGKATDKMREGGLANWALTMGRQRLGALALRNHPQFLQNLDLPPRLDTKIDIAALDIIRDRERGIPRFNEFRRQIGLRQLTSFDDFIDRRLPEGAPELAEQRDLVKTLREVYGQHQCDAANPITTAQLDVNGQINDCLGHLHGSMVDNIEDLDLVVGFLAETTRPHGFAISETQFHIFILNASRRLFSDRFFTSSYRPEFYTHFGIDWVNNNGPGDKVFEDGAPNGHREEVAPLKRVLLRAMPELGPELRTVVNSFDPWARDRGQYYSLEWKPRADAATDPAFRN
jgi:heme peroxidase